MKKLLYLLMTSIVAMGLMVGCSKDDDPTPEEQQKQEEKEREQEESKNASLVITMYDNTTKTYLSGANATLYNASDDAVVALIVANDKGVATFSNLDISKTYYFAVINYNGQNYVSEDEIRLAKGENRKDFTIKSTILTITVKSASGSAVSGAYVKLFANASDYEKGTNIVGGYSKTTNSNGQVTFNDLDYATTYYFSVTNDTQTNESGTYYKYCSQGENTVTTTIKEDQTGTIRLNNNATGSDGGTYKFTVKNTTTGFNKTYTVSSGYYQDLTNMPIGNYSVYMEQLDGYAFYATTGTLTGTLQKGYRLTFSTGSL